MGANQSNSTKAFCEYTKEEIASLVLSYGTKYGDYVDAITENGMDGAYLTSLTEAEFLETLDDLEITSRLHRRKLQNEFAKAVVSSGSGGSKRGSLGGSSHRYGRSESSGSLSLSNNKRSSLGGSSSRGYGRSESGSSLGSLSSLGSVDSLGSVNSKSNYSRASIGSLTSKVSVGGSQAAADLLNAIEQDQAKLRESLIAVSSEHRRERKVAQKRRFPPESRAALVLTDIQGSTSLWEAAPIAMRKALTLHDTIMRKLISDHCGYEITTEGDAFSIAFHEATDALNFTLALQEEMNAANWASEFLALPWAAISENGRRAGPRVRCAVHMGDVKTVKDPCSGRISYTGDAMEVAKSLEGVTFGGQIVTTEDTYKAALSSGGLRGLPLMAPLGEHIVIQKKSGATSSSSSSAAAPVVFHLVEVSPMALDVLGFVRQPQQKQQGSAGLPCPAPNDSWLKGVFNGGGAGVRGA